MKPSDMLEDEMGMDMGKSKGSPMSRICKILGVPKEKEQDFEDALGDLIEEHVSAEDMAEGTSEGTGD
jgi:hypothetical protein